MHLPKPNHAALLLVAVLALMVAPDAVGQDPSELSQSELEARVEDLFARSCAQAGCHAGPVPQMGMDLSRDQFYASVVGVPSQERPDLNRVAPGQPDSSYLFMKITGHQDIVGLPMPQTGERLSQEDISTVEAWIAGLDAADAPTARPAATEEVYPFYGWKVMNLPTTRALEAGSWLFLISHRFNPKLGDGYDTFFGLDGSAIIYLSMGYAVTDRFLVALGRSNAADDVELQLRYRLVHQQRPTGPPVSVSAQAAVNWVSEKPPGIDERFRSEAFKFTGQVSLTHAVSDRIGLALVPGILLNPAERVDDEPPLLTLGLGGRWRFGRNLSIVGEWVPIVSGYTRTTTFGNDNRFDTWGGGLEIATAGHVFQIVVSNSVGLATDQYLRGGDLDLRDGHMRLGFNIFRILNF